MAWSRQKGSLDFREAHQRLRTDFREGPYGFAQIFDWRLHVGAVREPPLPLPVMRSDKINTKC